jgi:hypothetical protein
MQLSLQGLVALGKADLPLGRLLHFLLLRELQAFELSFSIVLQRLDFLLQS